MNKHVLGFDIGGTKSAVILARVEGDEIIRVAREQIKTPVGWSNTLDTLSQMAFRLMETTMTPAHSLDAIGISCGGPLDGKSGMVYSPPNLPGWDRVPVTSYLENIFKKPARLRNDADACALAEWKYGAGKGTEHMIFLTFGTGLGAGLILNSRLYTGASNLAGEVGHIRLSAKGPEGYGKAGSFEGYCSGGGIRHIGIDKAKRAFKEGKTVSYCLDETCLDAINAHDIAKAALGGAKDALAVYRLSGRYFGKGLAILIDLLNPQKIVVGSIYARSRSLLDEAMIRQLRKECLAASLRDCSIVAAELGEAIGDYAAIVSALDS